MATERIQRRIDRLLDQIEEAADQQDWEKALTLAHEVTDLDPDNEDAAAFLRVAERRVTGATANAGDVAQESAVPPPSLEPASDQPASFSDGRYVVKRFLGEGGKKQVYLAHDQLLDRDVAFALIKTEGLDLTSRTRISREAQAMGRLGSHPHIVTVFDLGDHSGQPYMVTELMGGGDVEGVVEDAPDHKLPLEQAISISIETCRGLEFAHSRGIVHRDLKPGNVWLTADGTAKIGDFGLAVATDRSRLTQMGMMVGTVSYMPPEQAMGGEVSPRSDLYSLGAMLYEMVTGRPPFLGDDSVAIIGQHINTPPVAPTWHRSECPRPLESLIMRLLSKNPEERPESASDVLTALEAIDLSADVGATGESPDGDAHILDSLAGGVFVGRQQEMNQLKAALEDALSGRGRMVTLVGEPGIGKTRTAQELATYAGLRGCQVLWGRCHESRGAPPYWPWVQVIRSYVREHEPAQISTEMGSGAADIAEIVSDVRERLPDLKSPSSMEDPEQARFRLFDSITAFLRSASRSQPLVVILDNLHWADKPSLLLLEFLAPELVNSRLMLIGTYRDVDLSRQHPLAETLGELTRERLFERVLLRGLSQSDVGRFIEVVSGIVPPRGLVHTVHTQTEGNPLFVTEVVRLLVQEGELTQERVKDRESWDVRIPEGVREVIGRRLNRLTERCNQTLTIAAVIGREFEMRQLTRLVDDMSEDRLLEVLEEGLSARVIEEMPSAVGVYQFTHALIQQTLFAELTTTRRVRLHARIVEVFEKLYSSSIEAHAVDLAYHASEAEAMMGAEKLVRYSLMAGERALASYANEDALIHFERALAAKEGQPVDIETASILFGLGRAQAATFVIDQGQEAVDTLIRAFDAFVDLRDTENAVTVATYPHFFRSYSSGTADMTARALDLVRPDSLEAGYLLSHYGGAISSENRDYEGAQKNLDRAVEIARHEGDRVLEVRALVNILRVHHGQGNYREVVEQGPPVIELAQSLDVLDQLALARYLCANALLVMGYGNEAQIHATAGLETAEHLHNSFWRVATLNINTTLAILKGEWKNAQEFNARALAESPRDVAALGDGALVNLHQGNLEESIEYIKHVLKVVPDVAARGALEHAYAAAAIPLHARVTGTTELLDVGELSARESLSSPSRATSRVINSVRAGLALVAIQRNDVAVAKEQYSYLKSGQNTQHIVFICSDRLLGLLAQTMGILDDAQTHFEDALAFCRKAGYRPELAWSLCDYADMLLERNVEGDHDKAVTLLDESLAIATALGMRPLMERVLSRREILKA